MYPPPPKWSRVLIHFSFEGTQPVNRLAVQCANEMQMCKCKRNAGLCTSTVTCRLPFIILSGCCGLSGLGFGVFCLLHANVLPSGTRSRFLLHGCGSRGRASPPGLTWGRVTPLGLPWSRVLLLGCPLVVRPILPHAWWRPVLGNGHLAITFGYVRPFWLRILIRSIAQF